jgi:hypothetical protein
MGQHGGAVTATEAGNTNRTVLLQIANIKKHNAMPEITQIISIAGTGNGNCTSQPAL